MQCSHVTIFTVLAVMLIGLAAADEIINKREVEDSDINSGEPKRKRPFCNAFTGCGRKRSDDSMGSLVDMGSEPAVAELSRQILSEAKMWEAIQEARQELQQQRHRQLRNPHTMDRDQLQLTSFRKRRDVSNMATKPQQPQTAQDGPRRR